MLNGIAWISNSQDEVSRVRAFLGSLRTAGVLDELGFGIMQARFAERFYPAVTTVMTNARYLLFIPALYRHLEAKGAMPGTNIDRLSRSLQDDLCGQLLASGEKSPIGKDSRRRLVRTPSNIYWNGLAQLGIATRKISETSYHEGLAAGEFGDKVIHDQDKVAHLADSQSLWDAAVPLEQIGFKGEWRAGTSLKLYKREAEYLQKRYATAKPDGRVSIMSHLLNKGPRVGSSAVAQFDYLWEIPDIPAESQQLVRHAQLLSMFSCGTTLLFHDMLLQLRKDERAGEAFVGWWASAKKKGLTGWDLDTFFAQMLLWQGARSSDRVFVREWITRCFGYSSGTAALRSERLRELIRTRESETRPGRERLKPGHHRETWSPWGQYESDALYLLDYRHRRGRIIASDIVQGLERGQ